MRSRGVRFEHYEVPGAPRGSDIVDAGGARAAWFKDSEGNILALIQSLYGELSSTAPRDTAS